MRETSAFWAISVILIAFLMGCDTPTTQNSGGQITPVPIHELTVKIGRLDHDVFAVHPDSIGPSVPKLTAKYGGYIDTYFRQITRVGNPNMASFNHQVKLFATDVDMRKLFDDAQRTFGNLSNEEAQLSQALTIYNALWPDSVVPAIVADITGLNYGIVVTDSAVGIGLDMFLGAEYPMYPALGLPLYLCAHMTPDQVVPQTVLAWMGSLYDTRLPQSTLLDRMVFHGKMLLALDTLLPNLADAQKIAFTPNQLAWTTANEAKIWRHLVEKDLLYRTNDLDNGKWIEHAPFVPGLPREAPGRLGRWVGWRIVGSFAARNKNLSLIQILDTPAQTILQGAAYRPKD